MAHQRFEEPSRFHFQVHHPHKSQPQSLTFLSYCCYHEHSIFRVTLGSARISQRSSHNDVTLQEVFISWSQKSALGLSICSPLRDKKERRVKRSNPVITSIIIPLSIVKLPQPVLFTTRVYAVWNAQREQFIFRSTASSKASSPYSAMWFFVFYVQHFLVSFRSSNSCLRLLPRLPVTSMCSPVTCFVVPTQDVTNPLNLPSCYAM